MNHHLHIEEFEKEKKYLRKPHLSAPLPMKPDYLALCHYLDLEKTGKANQGARDHEK